MDGLVIFLTLLAVGLIIGRTGEAMHYRRLREQEAELAHILVFSDRNIPGDRIWTSAHFVSGSAVMSHDYFSSVLAGLRKIFGGRIRLYENLVERARREAVLRMKRAAEGEGADFILNVKFTTTQIGTTGNVTTVEVLAFGTALGEAGGSP